MRIRYKYLVHMLVMGCDLVVINVCYTTAVLLLNWLNHPVKTGINFQNLLVYNLSWIGAAGFWGLYRTRTLRTVEDVFSATWRTALTHNIGFLVFMYTSSSLIYPRQFTWILMGLFSCGFLLSRFLFTILESLLRQMDPSKPCVAVLGYNMTGKRLAAFFTDHPLDYNFSGFLDEGYRSDDKEVLFHHLSNGIRKAAKLQVKELYVSLAPDMMIKANALMDEAEAQCIRLKLVPDLAVVLSSDFGVHFLHNFPVISLRAQPMDDMRFRAQKRLFDILFSSLVIVLLLSWLYPIIALIIKFQSPGPVLFRQLRSGRNNDPFWCYKFRSMRLNKESDLRQATPDDERVTRIGRFLRRTSMDELPQFFNVLKGEMSVVGPRPHMLRHTEQYRALIDTFMVRHFIKPGITGWAQVNGLRGQTKEDTQMTQRLEKDLEYMKKWSLMLDVRIIFLTLLVTAKGDVNAF